MISSPKYVKYLWMGILVEAEYDTHWLLSFCCTGAKPDSDRRSATSANTLNLLSSVILSLVIKAQN